MNSEIFYSLNTRDLQTVATETLDRELTNEEIEKVKNKVGDNINWFEAIESTILSEINNR